MKGKTSRILLWTAFGAVVIALVWMITYISRPNVPSSSSDDYVSEYERTAPFLGPHTKLKLTAKEIKKFATMAENGDKRAAEKLAQFYDDTDQKDLEAKYRKLAE
jgi:hypothetical protein